MRTVMISLIFLLCVASASSAGSQPVEELRQVNAWLQAEYDQAKSGKPYLMIDLMELQLQLKVNGLVLQSWDVDSYRPWGHPVALKTSLESRTSLAEPERDIQVVNTTEPNAAAVNKTFKALELADMPTSYRMHMENGTDISVRTTPDGWFDRLCGLFSVPTWYLSRPLISIWNSMRGLPYNELALSMSEQDARTLYWAFNEGTPCLIRLPAAVAATAPSPAGTKRS
jgi:hypothetical protein